MNDDFHMYKGITKTEAPPEAGLLRNYFFFFAFFVFFAFFFFAAIVILRLRAIRIFFETTLDHVSSTVTIEKELLLL